MRHPQRERGLVGYDAIRYCALPTRFSCYQPPLERERSGDLNGRPYGFVRPIFFDRKRLSKSFEVAEFLLSQLTSNFFK